MTKEEFRKNMADSFANILEEKGLLWRKEWAAGAGAPCNGITRACYQGVNAFWLSLVSMMKGYKDSRWVTMKQIIDRGGKYHPGEKWHLKKGSKASHVEYWMPFDTQSKKALTWDAYRSEVLGGRREAEFGLVARYTAVFNAGDVDGIKEPSVKASPDIAMDSLVERLSENMGVPILLDGGDRAFYSVREDRIHLPEPESFENEYAFNATALHELGHATGHVDRLNRARDGIFSLDTYAYEELVAEMCSCFAGFGLAAKPSESHIENHKAYVQSWISAIRQKPEALVHAIKDAKTAAMYMDWKAGLIKDSDYIKMRRSIKEVQPSGREGGRIPKEPEPER